MITIAEALRNIVEESPLLEDGIARGLLNISAVAREIRPQIEEVTHKDVTNGAVVMALRRLGGSLAERARDNRMFQHAPDIVVRSNLFELTLANSLTLPDSQQRLSALAAQYRARYFMTITSGVFETTIIASSALYDEIMTVSSAEEVVSSIADLSSITIRLDEEIIVEPGSYARILKLMAWRGINIIEVVSTYLELTIVLKQDQADNAFSVLKKAFKP